MTVAKEAGSVLVAYLARGIASGFLVMILVVAGCDSRPAETEPLTRATPTPTTEPEITPTPVSTPDTKSDRPAVPTPAVPTMTPEPLPTRHSRPTATPTSTPEITATPAPTPTPSPPPEPAVYSIEDAHAEVGVDKGKVATRFSFRLRNTGGPAGPETVQVAVETIGEDPEIVLEVPALEAGGVAELSFTRSLRPLRQPVRISVGDVVATVEVDARTADLQMGEVHWAIAGDGVTDLKVELSNEGSIAAQRVVVRAFSRPAVIDNGEASIAENSVVIDSLLPEARDTATLPLTIPSGTHVVTLSAYTETMEVILDNNNGEETVEVEYVRLRPAVESVEVGAYETDGDGVADVTIVVVNGGESASGPVEVGVVCQGEPVEGCGQSAVAESIPAGGRGEVSVELTIPQGETPVVVYAGGDEDGYRWGEENVQESVITIPEKAAVSFVLEAKADVTGYWSNGMAEVMVTASLRNDGYEPIGESQVIAVECRQEGDTLNDCGGEL